MYISLYQFVFKKLTVYRLDKYKIIGFKIFDKNSIILVFETISIIPLHKHVVPINVNVKFTALSVDKLIAIFN